MTPSAPRSFVTPRFRVTLTQTWHRCANLSGTSKQRIRAGNLTCESVFMWWSTAFPILALWLSPLSH